MTEFIALYQDSSFMMFFISLLMGSCAVCLTRRLTDFRGILLYFLGGLACLLADFTLHNPYVLHESDLSYNFVAFVNMMAALLASIALINSASLLLNHFWANKVMLTLYITVGLCAGIYYCFIQYNPDVCLNISALMLMLGVFLTFFAGSVLAYKMPYSGQILFVVSTLFLLSKIIVSVYFTQNETLNFNTLNWLWIYPLCIGAVCLKLQQFKEDLTVSLNKIDRLNMQTNNMIDSSPFPILIAKITGDKLLFINNKAAELFGIVKQEAGFYKLKNLFVDERNRADFFSELEKSHEVNNFDIMVYDMVNSTPFWLSASAKTIEFNNEIAIYMAFQDITVRKQRETKLQSQADKDPLTMTWNRRYFAKYVPQKIKESLQKSKNFSLLMIDADHFKNVNDTFGHKNGDKVLIAIAETCKHSLRENDVVARFGGEEFVIFLNDTDSASAAKVAERLRQNIEEAVVYDDSEREIQFTVSIGYVSSEKTASLEILLRQADDAMYLAKNMGRNRISGYDEQKIKELNVKKEATNTVHPVFQNEDGEEFSLIDSYGNDIL